MTAATLLALVGPGVWLVGFLLPVAIVALVAYGVFELVRARPADGATAAPGAPSTSAGSAALGILDERFAHGEIDAEEYVQRRSLLWSGSSPAPTDAPTAPPATTAAPPSTDPVATEPATTGPVAHEEATSEQPVATVEPDERRGGDSST